MKEPVSSNYDKLIGKIDEFIRKYYLNQVLRGCCYLAATFFIGYLILVFAEYFVNFSSAIRTVLFYVFLLANGLILLKWIVLPLLSYFKLGTIISHDRAAEIIGQHFSDVKDKLLNTLQLHRLSEINTSQKDLILAGINQKIAALNPIPFTRAIKHQENKKYLKYILPPLAVILFIAFAAPQILNESTIHLIQYKHEFKKKAPFQFIILNKKLSPLQGDDFLMEVKLNGNEIPSEIYLEDGANNFKLNKENLIRFNYTFRNIQEDKTIRLYANNYFSEPYHIKVRRKPYLLNFDVHLHYPRYIKKADQILNNTGELSVPEGTRITWKIKTLYANQVQMQLGNQKLESKPSNENISNFTFVAKNSLTYSINPQNKEVKNAGGMSYPISVIPDRPATIVVDEKGDSLNSQARYFTGNISDDYGFSKLQFHYQVFNQDKMVKKASQKINFNRNLAQSSFLYFWNIPNDLAKPGNRIEYYFEVWDNDGVNGPKATRSATKTYQVPSPAEIENQIESTSAAVKQNISQAINQAQQIEQQSGRINRELLDKKTLSYEDKKQIDQLLEKQKTLEQLMNSIKQENKKNQFGQQMLNNTSKEILEKQKQIDQLFNQVLDEKTKQLLESIRKLLEQNNKDLTQQQLSQLKADNKNVQKELDRILELYKQLEFEQKLTAATDRLKTLANEQKILSEQTLKKSVNVQKLIEKQEQLTKSFGNFKEQMKALEQKNGELEQKNNFRNPENEEEQISRFQQQSSKQLKNNSNQAALSQQKASSAMQQLAQKLQQLQKQDESRQIQINLKNLRLVLDNLIKSSFEQEKIMEKLKSVSINDALYRQLSRQQEELKENLQVTEDSLYSLSRKVPQINATVNKELATVNANISKAVDNLSEQQTMQAGIYQKQVMTSLNNLGLMLSDVMDQLQKMMQNGSNHGQGNQKTLSQLRQMQNELNKNMQKARQQIQQQGEHFRSSAQMSEEMAKMARQQQIIRQALQKINLELNKDGQGKLGNLAKVSQEMEQTETDLVNKRIEEKTLIRQQQILSKLLDAEKAERERDWDTKRESKAGIDQAPNMNIILKKYKDLKQSELKTIQTIAPALKSYYKIKVEDYLKLLNSGN